MNTLFSAFIVLATFSGVAQAHFRLLFPEPRGVFVADIEPNFCGQLFDMIEETTGISICILVYLHRWLR